MKYLFLLLTLVVTSARATTVWTEFYCQTTGAQTNSGQSTNAVIASNQNGNWDSTTGIFVCSGATDLSGVAAGDWASIYNDGATVGVFVARILTVVDATDTITVSLVAKFGTAPTTSATARSITIGGPFKGPNAADGFPFTIFQGTATNSTGYSPRFNLKNNGLYTISAGITLANVAGSIRVQGYSSLPGDGGRAILEAGATSGVNLLTLNCKNVDFWDMELCTNGASGTADGVVSSSGTENSFERCVFHDMRGSGLTYVTVNHVYSCEGYRCVLNNGSGKAAFNLTSSGCLIKNTIAHHNITSTAANGNGFLFDGGINMIGCISAFNSGAGVKTTSDVSQTMDGCSFYTNGGAGIELAGSVGPNSDPMLVNIINCAIFANSNAAVRMNNNAGSRYLNGHIQGLLLGTGTMTNQGGNFLNSDGISQDGANFYGLDISSTTLMTANLTPWTAPNTGNFKFSTTGGLATGAGYYLETYPASTWTGTQAYPDSGAAQSASTNSTGSGSAVTRGGYAL